MHVYRTLSRRLFCTLSIMQSEKCQRNEKKRKKNSQQTKNTRKIKRKQTFLFPLLISGGSRLFRKHRAICSLKTPNTGTLEQNQRTGTCEKVRLFSRHTYSSLFFTTYKLNLDSCDGLIRIQLEFTLRIHVNFMTGGCCTTSQHQLPTMKMWGWFSITVETESRLICHSHPN